MNVDHPAARPFTYVVIGLLGLAAAAVLVQPDAARTQTTSGDWEPPLTAHGHPDLQGNWTNQTLTPFERPEGQGPVLNPDEVTAIEG